jgi:hypothetical protein
MREESQSTILPPINAIGSKNEKSYGENEKVLANWYI